MYSRSHLTRHGFASLLRTNMHLSTINNHSNRQMTFKVLKHFGERKGGDVALAKVSLPNGLGDETELVIKQYSAVERSDPEYDPREYFTEVEVLKMLKDKGCAVNLKTNIDAYEDYPWNT